MVAVMTDTNSGISVREGREHGVYVLPMPVIVSGRGYTEGIDIDQETLIKAMAEGQTVQTSQPSPMELSDMWDQLLKEGAEEIVYIPMSSGLSGSCAMAQKQAQKYRGRVFVVDNHRISVTQRSSVLDAVHFARQGLSGEMIRQRLESSAFDASIYICVQTLDHLKKSNRVTAAGASLASAFNLHPVLNIRGGKLDAQCVVHGDKNTQKTLIRLMESDMEKRFQYISPEKIDMYTAGTFIDPEKAEAWRARVQEAVPAFSVSYHPLSCSIACHVGWDALGIGITIKEREG